ncbi:BCCT family transporter, partial [Aduncisulcus paluster]
LSALQTAVISTGLPFAIILMLMSFMLIDSVRKAYRKQREIKQRDHFEEMIEVFDIVTEESDIA